MKKMYAVLIVFSIASYYSAAQSKNCYLSADDFIHLVGADSKTVNKILLEHCYAVDNSAKNGAKANFRRNYREGRKSQNDCVFTVASGVATFVTTSKATFSLYKKELQKKGFTYCRPDEDYGLVYEYDKYELYAAGGKDEKGDSSYMFMLDWK